MPPGCEIVGEAADGMRRSISRASARPDVILLDIAMREVDGFDVARHLRRRGRSSSFRPPISSSR